MSRGASTRKASLAEARSYLAKAKEFLRAAQDSAALGNHTAAVGNAVHAGISAGDALSAVRTGTVWTGEHAGAAGHLERSAGDDGRSGGSHLRRLLPMKNRAEYDPNPMRKADANAAVVAAERLVAIAGAAVDAAPPP